MVAIDKTSGEILPFQELNTRAKKHVSEEDLKVNVQVYPFDLLYLNNKPVIQENLEVRRGRSCARPCWWRRRGGPGSTGTRLGPPSRPSGTRTSS